MPELLTWHKITKLTKLEVWKVNNLSILSTGNHHWEEINHSSTTPCILLSQTRMYVALWSAVLQKASGNLNRTHWASFIKQILRKNICTNDRSFFWLPHRWCVCPQSYCTDLHNTVSPPSVECSRKPWEGCLKLVQSSLRLGNLSEVNNISKEAIYLRVNNTFIMF